MKKKKLLSVVAVILSVFSILPSTLTKSYAEESHYPTIEEYTEGYVKVETGSLFDYYDWVIEAARYDREYDVYVKVVDGNILWHYIALSPENKYAQFVISESVDLDEAWNAIVPIVEKYNFCFSLSTYEKKCGCGSVTIADNQTMDEFVKETENLMEDLKNTGYVAEFYPPGSVNSVYLFTGNAECLIAGNPDKKEDLIKYINLNFPDYSFVEGEFENSIKLIPPENITIQERFDIVQHLYENCNVMPTFSSNQDAHGEVGNGIKLIQNAEPSSTTPAETIETTTSTVSTTVTTELTTEPTETTTSTVISTITILPTATTTTTIPAITTTVTTPPTTTSLSELTTTTTLTTITAPQPTEQPKTLGDADGDNELTVRDCSFIAITIAQGRNSDLSDSADFNKDGEVNVRDAAAIAKNLAQVKS